MDYSSNLKNKIQNVYLFSYIILILSAIFGRYSEFSIGLAPMLVKMIWEMGITIFLCIQCALLFANINKMSSFIIPVMLLISCSLTLAGYPIIKLRMFILILLILNIKCINYKKIVRVDFYIKLIGLVSLFGMYVLDLFPLKYRLFDLSIRQDGLVRKYWGFNHPNTLGEYYIYFLITAILLINTNSALYKLSVKSKYIYTLLIFGSGWYIEFLVTDSRSAQVALMIIFIGWIFSVIGRINSLKPKYGYIILMSMICLSLILDYQFFINDDQFAKINSLFSNRLVLQKEALVEYGIHLFGNPLFKSGHPFEIDNQYIYNLLALGIIGLLLFISIFILALRNAYRTNDFILYIILIAIMVKAMFESTILDFYAMFPIIYAFMNRQIQHSVV